jgi:hypothetical protein
MNPTVQTSINYLPDIAFCEIIISPQHISYSSSCNLCWLLNFKIYLLWLNSYQLYVCIHFNDVCWGQRFSPGELQVPNSLMVARTGWLFWFFILSEQRMSVSDHLHILFYTTSLTHDSSSRLLPYYTNNQIHEIMIKWHIFYKNSPFSCLVLYILQDK